MNRNLSAFILIVIAVGLYVTVTQGIIASANQIKSVNDQYISALTNAQRLISVRDQVLQEYNAISQNDRDRLDKMIPSTVDNIRLVIDLNSIAARHGLTFAGISATVSSGNVSAPGQAPVPASPTPPPSEGPADEGLLASSDSVSAPVLDTVTVSFSVNATYQQLISLLQDIESDLRIMDLTHLSVTANDTGTYNWSLQFQTYWTRQTT